MDRFARVPPNRPASDRCEESILVARTLRPGEVGDDPTDEPERPEDGDRREDRHDGGEPAAASRRPVVSGSEVHARSGRPGSCRSGRWGGGKRPGSISTMVGAVSAKADGHSSALANEAPALEGPVDEHDLGLELRAADGPEITRVGRPVHEVSLNPELVLA